SSQSVPIHSPHDTPLVPQQAASNASSCRLVMMSGGVSGVESSSSSGSCGAAGVAPFVAKTYGMMDDRATDGVVAWGPAGNSFVVADPFAFSEMLLPAHFKHANFSSFVRQLNTYGFRKVDPDRWEFAHASFLRGQTHLLRHIVRRQSSKRGKDSKEEDDDDGSSSATALAMEVVRLRNEQRAAEERVAAMWRRVQETERRPKQMLAFLLKVVGDPDVLHRLPGEGAGAGDKRPRLLLDGRQEQRMSVDGAGVGVVGLSYHNHSNLNLEEAYVLEPGVDLYYAGGDGFGDVQADGGPPYAFHMDSGY
uniref:HSF-type DNA-binding domain-containing protein n=1 Tax=Aegilops tauschii subsp. strangulata TaxID=200361 RepID=A0A453JCL4_AEGTS